MSSDADVLDSLCDSLGASGSIGDDWSDCKNSERKKRDRFLADEVVLQLIKKSDFEGLKRLFCHLTILIFGSGMVLKYTFNWWSVVISTSAQFVLYSESHHRENLEEGNLLSSVPLFWMQFWLSTLSFIVALFIHGFILQCLSYCCQQHECLHGTAFRTKKLNTVVGFLASLPCFEFSTHEKLMHKPHHTWVNDPKRDPELTSFYPLEVSTAKGFRKVAQDLSGYYAEFLYLHETIFSHFARIYNCAIGKPVDYSGVRWSLSPQVEPEQVKFELQSAALIQILTYALGLIVATVYFGVTIKEMLIYWILPATLGFIPIHYVRNGEHSDCSMNLNGLTNTRSTMSHPVIRFLMWNMNLHAEHHLYPAVPFFNLPKLREHLKNHLQRKTDGFMTVNLRMREEWIPWQKEKKAWNVVNETTILQPCEVKKTE